VVALALARGAVAMRQAIDQLVEVLQGGVVGIGAPVDASF